MRSTLTGKNRFGTGKVGGAGGAGGAGVDDQNARDLGIPTPGPITILVGGIVIPILLVLYALSCIIWQEVGYSAYNASVTFYGSSAISIGIGIIALAGLLHCQFFWDSLYDSTLAGARSKLICLTIMGICTYYICFRCGFSA